MLALAVLLLAAAAPAGAQQDVDISLLQFGVRNAYRPGDFVGIELQLISNLDEAKNAEVVWEVPEASGDIVEYSRIVALTPGQPTSAWLYSKLLPDIDNSSVFTVRVYEDVDGRRGAELAATRISPGLTAVGPVSRIDSLIGVVGGVNTVGINDYNVATPGRGYPDLGHEFIWPVAQVAPVNLPDRWEGLDQFEAIVWTEANPGGLRDAQANAIREYAMRGGHFIIVLPQLGNEWQLGSLPVNGLSDLLPSTPPSQKATNYLELLPVLSKRRGELPATANHPMTIRVFDEASLDRGWEPLIATPEGEVVAIDRRFGFGRLTIIGIDLASQQLAGQSIDGGAVFEGEIIWNIVLGRRQDTLTARQLNTLVDDKEMFTGSRMSIDLGGGALIREKINLRGQAFAGIGLAFVLFVAYWLIAGPVGFGLLKGAKKVRHAWAAFALTSAAFTLLAWGGVKLFSQKHTQVQHLTFLDLIAERDPANVGESATGGAPPAGAARVTSWFTVFLPGYGKPVFQIEGIDARRDILTHFSPPGEEVGGFANVDRYEVALDEPADFGVPARSTTKEMYARYLGPIPPHWSSGDESIGFTVTEPIVVQNGRITRGRIIHNFPAALTNVRIMVVNADRNRQKRYLEEDGSGISGRFFSASDVGRAPNSVKAYSVAQIRALQEVDLAASTPPDPARESFDAHITKHYTDSKEDSVSGMTTTSSIGYRAERFLEMLSFYQMITPPEYRNTQADWAMDSRDRPYSVRRHLGREIDLSEWLTRPCIIICGLLENSELPLPLQINDSPPESEGLTIVRWIYPLPMTTQTATPPAPEEHDS